MMSTARHVGGYFSWTSSLFTLLQPAHKFLDQGDLSYEGFYELLFSYTHRPR
jgi:hypothetical protein